MLLVHPGDSGPSGYNLLFGSRARDSRSNRCTDVKNFISHPWTCKVLILSTDIPHFIALCFTELHRYCIFCKLKVRTSTSKKTTACCMAKLALLQWSAAKPPVSLWYACSAHIRSIHPANENISSVTPQSSRCLPGLERANQSNPTLVSRRGVGRKVADMLCVHLDDLYWTA